MSFEVLHPWIDLILEIKVILRRKMTLCEFLKTHKQVF